jgi:hypothetical protein
MNGRISPDHPVLSDQLHQLAHGMAAKRKEKRWPNLHCRRSANKYLILRGLIACDFG